MKNLPEIITELSFEKSLQYNIIVREIDSATTRDLETLKESLKSEIKQKMIMQSNISQLVKTIASL